MNDRQKSIRPRKNPSDSVIKDILPPVYKLNYLLVGGGRRLEPRFPIQIMATPGSDVHFRFWGAETYDLHVSFGTKFEDARVRAVNYSISFEHTSHHFMHTFDTHVILTLQGIKSMSKVIMKPYRTLDDMPKLPHDWTYFQFIN